MLVEKSRDGSLFRYIFFLFSPMVKNVIFCEQKLIFSIVSYQEGLLDFCIREKSRNTAGGSNFRQKSLVPLTRACPPDLWALG